MKAVVAMILVLATSACAQNPNTAAGAAIGAVAGAAIGAHNKVPVAGAITGAIVGGLVGNAVDQNTTPPPPPIPPVPSPDIIVKEAPVVVVETPVVIDERIWVGNDLWIYSYHGFRSPSGHVRYETRIPFHRAFIRGGVGYRWHR